MANKFTFLAVLVVATSVLGVGAFIGSHLPSDGEAVGTDTPTTTPPPRSATTTETATTTATATSTASPTATPRPTVSPAAFDAGAIEAAVLANVNAERRDRGIEPLSRDSRLDPMAQFHSDNMAGQGYPSHAAAGFSTEERYERFDQADRCRVPNDANAGIVSEENLEAVGVAIAGRPYETDDRTRIDRNESAVANAVVDDWFDDADATETLTLENARYSGVGVNVSDRGRVFVTVDLC